MDVAVLIAKFSIEGTPGMDASAWGVQVRDRGSGAAYGCTILSTDALVVAGVLGAPVAREVGFIDHLI